MITEQIPGQTTMPPEVPSEKRGPCAWCGEPSVDELVIRKGRYRNHFNPVEKKSIKQLVKPPVTAPVCDYHLRNLKLWGDESSNS